MRSSACSPSPPTSPAGANGVMFLPWLVGSMAPALEPRRRGGFVNLGLGPHARRHGPCRARRCRPERGVAAAALLRARRARVRPRSRSAAAAPHLRCGGRSSPTALGVPVRRLANPRTTNAHGAALLALVETGHADGRRRCRRCCTIAADPRARPRRPPPRSPDASTRSSTSTTAPRPFYAALNAPEDTRT